MPPSPSPHFSHGETASNHEIIAHTDVKEQQQATSGHIQCPFCLRPQTPGSQNLVCSSCNHKSLELVRNSVINNDQFNDAARAEIDDVFRVYSQVKHGELGELTTLTDAKRHPVDQDKNVPYASVKSVKFLCLQLLKLEIMNYRIKLKNIDCSQEVTSQKITQLKTKLNDKKSKLEHDRDTISNKKIHVSHQFNQVASQLHLQTVEYEVEKLYQIERQACKLQSSHFQIMKDIIFTYRSPAPSKRTAQSIIYSPARNSNTRKLLFFHQPIIPLKNFLAYNNKLISMNEFLENLIRLQIELYDIFKIGNNLMHLPYLEELKKYLPDSDFYNLVQEKENFVINGGNIPPEQSESVVDDKTVQPIEVKEISVDNERIIKLGGEIKLPLSSKTINYHLRKASSHNTTSPTRTKSQSPSSPAPDGNETKPQASTATKSSEVQAKSKKNPSNLLKDNLKGKKMIIIPHKILTKPFSKLTTKEYLRFLSIIVKILVNFKIFFSLTYDLLPDTVKQKHALASPEAAEGGLKKKSSIGSITSTTSASRSDQRLSIPLGDGANSSSVLNDDNMYDFEWILHRIANMDKFLEAKKEVIEKRQEQAQSKKSPQAPESAIQSMNSRDSAANASAATTSTATSHSVLGNMSSEASLASTANSNFSSAMNSIIKVDNFERSDRDKHTSAGKSPLRTLYNNLFREFKSKNQQDDDTSEQDVYGNFSDTHGYADPTDEPSTDTSTPSPLDEESWGNTGNHHKPDLKTIMEQVYQLITTGSRLKNQSNSLKSQPNKPAFFSSSHAARQPPPSLGPDTMSMMAESRAQLDDWDTISKMY